MLNALAQSLDTTTETAISGNESTGLAIFSGVFLLVWLAVVVVTVISMWKIFEKAGVEGWKAIIPGYNGWVLAEIAGKPGWWGIVGFGAIVPILGILASIAGFILYILIAIDLVKKFGKDTTYALLIIILPIIGLPMLAFGDAKYQGAKPAAAAGAAPSSTPPTAPAA